MKELKEVKVKIEQKFTEQWKIISEKSMDNLSLILLEIQNKYAKNPNGKAAPAYY